MLSYDAPRRFIVLLLFLFFRTCKQALFSFPNRLFFPAVEEAYLVDGHIRILLKQCQQFLFERMPLVYMALQRYNIAVIT